MRHWYKYEISKHVQLSWSCLGLNTHGMLELRNKITLGSRMIERLNRDIVSFDFTFDKEISKGSNLNCTVPCHKMLNIGFSVTNQQHSLATLRFMIQPYLDLDNGT